MTASSDSDQQSVTQNSISINSHCLTYPLAGFGRRPVARRVVGRAIPLLMITLLAVIGLAMASIRAVGAQDPQPDASSIEGVRIDLEPSVDADNPLSPAGAATEARYRELVIADAGIDLRVEPLAGSVRVELSQLHAESIVADINGSQVAAAAPGFGDALADALSSTSAHRYARFSATEYGEAVSVEVFYPRALSAADYLLVQEGGGNGTVELQALGADGTVIGSPITMGPNYQWNTGHGATGDSTAWASVLNVAALGAGQEPVVGIRVVGAYIEVKTVALAAIPVAPNPVSVTPTPVVDSPVGSAEGSAEGSQPDVGQSAYAAIGIEVAVQPAIAVDGVGCAELEASVGAAALAADTAVEPGQAATFCFIVTNLGTTNLADVTITDERLGLLAVTLPKASGPEILAPGQKAVYYYHSVLDERRAQATSVVTARSVDDTGASLTGVVEPTASNAVGGVAAAPGPEPASATGLAESDVAPVMAIAADQSEPTASAASAESAESAASAEPAESAAVTVTAATPGAGAQPVAADAEPSARSEVGETEVGETVAVTQLAMTGVPTDPWVLVVFAMAFIFIGYTVYVAAFDRRRTGEPCGHAQLDSLGFD